MISKHSWIFFLALLLFACHDNSVRRSETPPPTVVLSSTTLYPFQDLVIDISDAVPSQPAYEIEFYNPSGYQTLVRSVDLDRFVFNPYFDQIVWPYPQQFFVGGTWRVKVNSLITGASKEVTFNVAEFDRDVSLPSLTLKYGEIVNLSVIRRDSADKIPGAMLRISQNGQEIQTGVANGEGNFAFHNLLPAGTYEVQGLDPFTPSITPLREFYSLGPTECAVGVATEPELDAVALRTQTFRLVYGNQQVAHLGGELILTPENGNDERFYLAPGQQSVQWIPSRGGRWRVEAKVTLQCGYRESGRVMFFVLPTQ